MSLRIAFQPLPDKKKVTTAADRSGKTHGVNMHKLTIESQSVVPKAHGHDEGKRIRRQRKGTEYKSE